MKNEQIKSAPKIDKALFEKFRNQVKEKGFVQERAIEAAIRIWVELPTSIQARSVSREICLKNLIVKALKTAVGTKTA